MDILGIIADSRSAIPHHPPAMSSQPLRLPEPDVNEAAFRHALSQFATGVTVITTRDDHGGFVGLTASSFNSVSLTPPLVLWSLSASARTMPLFRKNSHYVINVLAADQAAIAERFASRIENRFEGRTSASKTTVKRYFKNFTFHLNSAYANSMQIRNKKR